ncbi:MAG: hypothetical protein A3J63_02785 [Candidatus Moranbacteria bacterium RIFCSPHIGHO2_02_FULL_40_12b]|nr:MAG: hypothetical protein A3J63_02785 [Candidatus Moranbacteria bacterium RIFCSPHIGHO2_02_FULL_40_12b]
MKKILRNKSILTGKNKLEQLYEFKKFPVFMGCVDNLDDKNDINVDMSFSICRDTGIIQLDELLPLDLIYQNQHNDGVGKIWQEHYVSFAKFLEKFNPKEVLEIGGANDFIANYYLERNPKTTWTIIEPHPLFKNKKIKIIKRWFDESFVLKSKKIDTIMHSHVLEHTYEPIKFIKHIAKFSEEGSRHIFTIPNMVEQLSRKYTNCLNFEHTLFLAEPFIDYILRINGFKILKKSYFQDHSIFYATEKIKLNKEKITLPKKYSQYKKLFSEFVKYHQDLINSLNKKIDKFDGDIYLFGAHIFSQYLLEFGLNKKKIKGILDNSDLKNGKRLYGTNLIVKKPETLKGRKNVAIILKVGAYRNEIIKQVKKINPNIVIFE